MAWTFSQHASNFYSHLLEMPEGLYERYYAWKEKTWLEQHEDVGTGSGRPFPEEFIPKRLRLIKGKRLFDYGGYGLHSPLVSTRFKEAVEAIAPGLHQFVPVEVVRKDGTPYGEEFWFFAICAKLDAISPAFGGVYQAWHTIDPTNKPDAYSWTIKAGATDDQLAVHAERIAGVGLWVDRRMTSSRFISDAMLAEFTKRNVKGFSLTRRWQEI